MEREEREQQEARETQESLEKERLRSQYAAKMASLGEMAGGMAHEINTPLAVIQTVAEQLVSDLLSNSANVNVYDADGTLTDHIDWTGSPREAVSVCGTFVTMLMKHTYGFTDAQYKAKTGSSSPSAAKSTPACTLKLPTSGFQIVPVRVPAWSARPEGV